MNAISTIDHGAEILTRAIQPAEGNLPVEAARSILSFHLSPTDWDRVNELAAKARTGTLTTEERAELDEYERITYLLELMQSKARLIPLRVLSRSGGCNAVTVSDRSYYC